MNASEIRTMDGCKRWIILINISGSMWGTYSIQVEESKSLVGRKGFEEIM